MQSAVTVHQAEHSVLKDSFAVAKATVDEQERTITDLREKVRLLPVRSRIRCRDNVLATLAEIPGSIGDVFRSSRQQPRRPPMGKITPPVVVQAMAAVVQVVAV